VEGKLSVARHAGGIRHLKSQI